MFNEKEYMKEYYKRNKDKIKARTKNWKLNNRERKTELNKIHIRKHKEYYSKKVREWQKNHIEIYKAQKQVYYAIRRGQIPKAKTLICVKCGQQAKEYHHYKGYLKENWLDVIPLCKKCHFFIDK
jgi:hypothetical protein